MNYEDYLPVIRLMEDVGQEIACWRNDVEARIINSIPEFKTQADDRAHKIICTGLSSLFPGVSVISEEDQEHSDRPSEYWLIDPIDGTASWYHGYDGFVTQAAFIKNNIPQFGVICAPVLNKTWSGLLGGGAFLNGLRLKPLIVSNRLIMTDNTSTAQGVTKRLSTALSATGYYESGSLGLKSVLVADGTVDLFVKDVCVRDWDLAPVVPILSEVGGCLSQIDGTPYIFDGKYAKEGGFLVARDPELLGSAVNILQ